MKGVKLKKDVIPNGHVLTLSLSRKTLEDLMIFQTGDIEIVFTENGDYYIPHLSEGSSAQVYGRVEKSENDDDSNVEPPIL